MTKRNYKNSVIYKLINKDNEIVLIGRTCMPLSKRLYTHKKKDSRLKKTTIILIEKFPCEDVAELKQRHQYWVEQLEVTSLN
jgi:hypothetical protein